jgi:hypothetical protein
MFKQYGVWCDLSGRWVKLFDTLQAALDYVHTLRPMLYHTYRVSQRVYNPRTTGYDSIDLYRTLPSYKVGGL